MSTAAANAYNYNARGDAFSYWPKYRKAQKSSGFRANRTHRRCIKDYVLIDCAEGSGGLMATLFRAIGLRRYNSLDRFPILRRESGLSRYGISHLTYNKVGSRV